MSEERSVATVPFHWAVAILVALVLPTGFLFGKFNFTLWVVFIGWAQYFLYGGTPEAFKITTPCYLYGAGMSAFWLVLIVAATPLMPQPYPVLWAAILTNFIAVTLLAWGLKFYKFGTGVVCVFGAFAMNLAIYFTGSMPKIGPMDNPYWVVVWAAVWDLLMGYFGHFLGWFNNILTFPRRVRSSSVQVGRA